MKENLSSIFKYDKRSGVLAWKKCGVSFLNGKPAGAVYKNGYIVVSINGKRYYAHRIAWLIVYGEWPKHNIDHINGVRSDNRLKNLRDISNRENCSNQFRHRKGRLVGAHFDKSSKGPSKWKTRIQIDGKIIHVGSSKTEEEAHRKYVNFKNERGLK